ncbi:MAG TPA: Gfo/Idh/MocA family oxidoreductase, partial [Abditibacteriaceae bacterium]|nr:Gfo/Idh/MocA family oxidoreductase [Abditibacteriaceae bacterium]
VADINEARLTRRAAIAGNIEGAASTDLTDIRTTTRIDELIADPEIDLLDFCLPTPLHSEYSIQALQAGKHVLCEKPMALTVEECEQMVAAASQSGKFLLIGHCLRFWPQYVAAQQVLESGELGKPLYARFLRRGGMPLWNTWMCDGAQSGGAILDLHVHDVDIALWWFGEPQKVTAEGVIHDGLPLKVDATWRYENGPLVSLHGGWDRNGGPFHMAFEVLCEGGTVAWDSAAGDSVEVRVHGDTREIAGEGISGYHAEIDDLLHCIQNNTAPARVTPQSGKLAVAIATEELRQIEAKQAGANAGDKHQ